MPARLPTLLLGAWSKLQTASVRLQMVVFGTVLAGAAILVSFGAVTMQIREQARSLLAETVGRNQSLLLQQQEQNLAQLLQTSRLITGDPTLRAAIETYRTESVPGSATRADLLATIDIEARKIASSLDRGLLIITDEQGRVLSAAGPISHLSQAGDDLSAWPIVERALAGPAASKESASLAVARIDGHPFQVGCVPILLQGYPIGALVLGDRIDGAFVDQLKRATEGEVVILSGSEVLASSLRELEAGGTPRLAATLSRATSTRPSRVVHLGDQEYVAASLPLGGDASGDPVTLHLMHSLTAVLHRPMRELMWTLALDGALAVLVAGVTAWIVSGSILRPLQRFMDFLGEVTRTGEYGHRFAPIGGPVEVQRLRKTYNHFIDTLMRDFLRIERLRESEKMAALGRMLSGAAHEINNPLTGVVGHVDLLLGRDGLDPDLRRPLEHVQRDGHRVVALVRSLLKTSHRDDGVRMAMDLNRVLREAVQLRQHDFVSADLEICLELEPGVLPVVGNELALQQVFLNIISNALDALTEVARPGRLTIRSRLDNGRALVVFADDGPGLKMPERVFEPFFTTKGVGKGTGLGLSLCQATVGEHDGRITAHNRPEGGAAFEIALPLAPEGTPLSAAGPHRGSGPGRRSELGELRPGLSVLVVDDEPSVLEVQLQIVEAMGGQAVGVRSGAEALPLLCARRFDLVVSDMKMPGGVSGLDLYRWIRENHTGGETRFVLVTGDVFAPGASGAPDEPEPVRLSKPFSIQEYAAVLREVLHDTRRAA